MGNKGIYETYQPQGKVLNKKKVCFDGKFNIFVFQFDYNMILGGKQTMHGSAG